MFERLQLDIKKWDLKSKSVIAQIYEQRHQDPNFLESVILLLADEKTEVGASWLLKHHLEKNNEAVASVHAANIFASVGNLNHWEAKLHILQCMEKLQIPGSAVKEVEKFLRFCLEDSIKFVRAWAYSGFHELASQHSQFRKEALSILQMANQTETAGSILARVRRKIKQGF